MLSVSSRALIDACARPGLDTGQILQAARLDPATLQDPDARIPIEQVSAARRHPHRRFDRGVDQHHVPSLRGPAPGPVLFVLTNCRPISIRPAPGPHWLTRGSRTWRALVLAAEVEKGALVRYAFGIGTRF